MSATLDAQPVSAFLDGCPIIDVPGRTHPIDITYHPAQTVADAAVDALAATAGPGAVFPARRRRRSGAR